VVDQDEEQGAQADAEEKHESQQPGITELLEPMRAGGYDQPDDHQKPAAGHEVARQVPPFGEIQRRGGSFGF